MPLKSILILFLFINLLNGDDESFKKIFNELKLDGTLILSSLKSNELYIYNTKRADTRYTAASTFKIPHTLIALNEGLIDSENSVFKWDGKTRDFDLWNRDQTLQTAIAVSCVWCFQQFTHKISTTQYLRYLSQFNYGNKTVGKERSSFWLNGNLKISAYEQVEFLKKLYHEDLPIEPKHINTLKKLITIEKNRNYDLKGKSGWDGRVGWLVGYITVAQNVYFFAMNADLEKEQLHLRQEIIYKAFRAKQII